MNTAPRRTDLLTVAAPGNAWLRDLERLVTLWCSATETPLSHVSHRIFADNTRLGRTFAGEADLLTGSYARAMVWLSEKWPDGTAWPSDIARPAPDAARPLVEAAE